MSVSSSSSTPSFTRHLNLKVLAGLATQTRGGGIACVVDEDFKCGSFNVVYFLKFVDGVKWVARIPISAPSTALETRMRLDKVALDFVGDRTTIPVPKILGLESTEYNALGRAYTFTTFLPGTQLAKLWFNKEWFTDVRRHCVLRSIAELMLQLSTHEFKAIGQLDADPQGTVFVGPFHPSSDTVSEPNASLEPPRGPYFSAHAYWTALLAREIRNATSTTVIAELYLLRSFAGMLPDSDMDGAPFYLMHPDFGYQNILINDKGDVTGIIDWDDTSIVPRQAAFARYPSWITRDWDPVMYSYRSSPVDAKTDENPTESNDVSSETLSREYQQEDSPERLQAFREEYLQIVTSLNREYGALTRFSHIVEAVEIAIKSSFPRADILAKLTKYVYGDNANDDVEWLSFVTLSRRLSTSEWLRETIGKEKLELGGDYI